MGKPKNFDKSQHNWMSFWRGSLEDKAQCPYNSKHVMPYKRLPIHIIHCAKKNPELAAQFVTCPYSSLHRFPPEQLEEHLKGCKEHEMFVHSRLVAGKAPYITPWNDNAEKNKTN